MTAAVPKSCSSKDGTRRSSGLPFRHALLFSLFLHGTVVLLAGGIVALLRISSDRPLPKVLQFTFLPDEKETQASAAEQNEPVPRPSPQSVAPEVPILSDKPEVVESPQTAESYIEHHRLAANAEPQQIDRSALASAEPGPSPTETSPTPDRLPIADEPSPIKSTYAWDRIRSRAMKRVDTFGPDFRMAPATLAIPAPQKARLEKHVLKLVRKLDVDEIRDSTWVWEEDQRLYKARLDYRPARSSQAFDELVIEISTSDESHSYRTEMRMRRLAFSHFAQFVDAWDPYVSIHDDVFDGRFHTNSSFNISTRDGVHPRFKGKVTTSGYVLQPTSRFWHLNTDSVFLAGIDMNTDIIHFPRDTQAWLDELMKVDSLYLGVDRETWIVFHPDGSFSWREKGENRSFRRKLPRAPFSVVGRNRAVIHVEGVVRGKVLVYSEGKIIIDGDLTYARHPAIFKDSPDFLGLVSDRDIEIAHPKVTGPGDLHLHAAMLARRYFRVPNLYGHGSAVLHIYGSLSAGSITATEPRYATRVKFDPRLERRRPPNFPMTDRFELLEWDGRWQVLDNHR